MTQVLDEARRMTGVRQFDDLSDEMKAKLAALPTNLTDVDDAIHNASARIQLMGRADEQVIHDEETNGYDMNYSFLCRWYATMRQGRHGSRNCLKPSTKSAIEPPSSDRKCIQHERLDLTVILYWLQ